MRILPLFAAALVLTLASASQALTLKLSEFSSDSTDPALLDATFDFSVAGNTLTLVVTNDTVGVVNAEPDDQDAYNINEIYFNGSSDVTGLTYISATHSAAGDVKSAWTFAAGSQQGAGAFGSFDFGLTDGVGETNPNLIGPGESLTLVFTILGTGPFDMNDFLDLSSNPPGSIQALIQAKFVNGAGDDSAFGATADENFGSAPEPATAALLGLGLVGLAVAGRPRRAPRQA